MKVYKTNAALQYQQYAYFILVDDLGKSNKQGRFACLVVDLDFDKENDFLGIYENGSICYLDKYEIEETDIKIEDYTKGNFLLKHFVETSDHEKMKQLDSEIEQK